MCSRLCNFGNVQAVALTAGMYDFHICILFTRCGGINLFIRVHFVAIHVGKIEVGPILEHLVFRFMLNYMCYVVNNVSTERRWPFAALNNDLCIRVCARCVSDHVHLQIVRRPVIAPDAVTKHVQSQTCVCGLRNRGCNSKTRCCCERQCPWMFALFAVNENWHVVCGARLKKVGAKNRQKETWTNQIDGISTLAVLAVFV